MAWHGTITVTYIWFVIRLRRHAAATQDQQCHGARDDRTNRITPPQRCRRGTVQPVMFDGPPWSFSPEHDETRHIPHNVNSLVSWFLGLFVSVRGRGKCDRKMACIKMERFQPRSIFFVSLVLAEIIRPQMLVGLHCCRLRPFGLHCRCLLWTFSTGVAIVTSDPASQRKVRRAYRRIRAHRCCQH